jgi:replicative DNA helicase
MSKVKVSDPYLEKGLPANIHIEKATLGMIILKPDLITSAMKLIMPEDFYLQSDRLIYRKMLDLHARGV